MSLERLFESDNPFVEKFKIRKNFSLLDGFINTGSTAINNSLNLSGGTITGNLNVSGLTSGSSAYFSSGLTGGTLYSGSTEVSSLFARLVHTHEISDVNNLSSRLNTKADLSGATFTGDLSGITISAGTLYSGTTDISNFFNTKISRSGDTFTGSVLIPVGSASAPGIGFSGNSNTGIYSLGSNTVGVTTNGVVRMSWGSGAVTTVYGALNPDSNLSRNLGNTGARWNFGFINNLTSSVISATTFSATTIYSGSTDLSDLFARIGSSGGGSTFTGGTVEGDTIFTNNLTATTFYSSSISGTSISGNSLYLFNGSDSARLTVTTNGSLAIGNSHASGNVSINPNNNLSLGTSGTDSIILGRTDADIPITHNGKTRIRPGSSSQTDPILSIQNYGGSLSYVTVDTGGTLNASVISGTTISGNTFTAGNGTASLPSYNFVGNTDSGWYSQSTNDIRFSLNGSARLVVNTTGWQFNNHVTSNQDGSFDLGATNKRFRNLFLISGITASTINIGEDTDSTSVIGRAKIGTPSGASDIFYLSHYDNFSLTNYALAQNATNTFLNAVNGNTLSLRIGNTAKVNINAAAMNVISGVIATIQDTTNSTSTGTGSLIVSGGTGIASNLWVGGNLNVSNDIDSTHAIGRLRIGSPVTDYAYIAHYDNLSSVNYALNQNSAGATSINAKTGQNVGLKINNSNIVTVTSSAVNIISGAILNVNDTTTSSSVSTGSVVIAGGVGISGNTYIGGSTIGLPTSGSQNIIKTNGSLLIDVQTAGYVTTLRTIGDANISNGVTLTKNGNIIATVNNHYIATISGTFAHTGNGSGTQGALNLNFTVNQSGSGTQPVHGIIVNPTITSVLGNLFGFRSRISSSFSGTGKVYNIYADGTAPNYFAGNVGIGSENVTGETAHLNILPTSASNIGLLIKGSVGQTADLVQIQDNTSSKIVYINSAGTIFYTNRIWKSGTTSSLTHDITVGTIGSTTYSGTRATFDQNLTLQANDDIRLQLNNGSLFFNNSSNHMIIEAASRTGTNAEAYDFYIRTQRGSGNSAPSDFIIETPLTGTSGTAVQTLEQRLKINYSAATFSVPITSQTISATTFLAENGTASAPSYSFSSDPDVGIFRSAANTLAFAVNATQRLTLTDGTITSACNINPDGNDVRSFGTTNAIWSALYTRVIQGLDRTGSNTSGPNLTLRSSRGTGNSAPSSIVLQTPLTGSSGSSLQTLEERFAINYSAATFSVPIVSGSTDLSNLFARSSQASQWISSGSNIYFTGNVGIGDNATNPTTASLVLDEGTNVNTYINWRSGTNTGSGGLLVGIDGQGNAAIQNRENKKLELLTNDQVRMTVTADGTVQHNTGHRRKITRTSGTATVTVTVTDNIHLADTSSGGVTYYLPSSMTGIDGQEFTFVKTSANNTMIISGTSGYNITAAGGLSQGSFTFNGNGTTMTLIADETATTWRAIVKEGS